MRFMFQDIKYCSEVRVQERMPNGFREWVSSQTSILSILAWWVLALIEKFLLSSSQMAEITWPLMWAGASVIPHLQ